MLGDATSFFDETLAYIDQNLTDPCSGAGALWHIKILLTHYTSPTFRNTDTGSLTESWQKSMGLLTQLLGRLQDPQLPLAAVALYAPYLRCITIFQEDDVDVMPLFQQLANYLQFGLTTFLPAAATALRDLCPLTLLNPAHALYARLLLLCGDVLVLLPDVSSQQEALRCYTPASAATIDAGDHQSLQYRIAAHIAPLIHALGTRTNMLALGKQPALAVRLLGEGLQLPWSIAQKGYREEAERLYESLHEQSQRLLTASPLVQHWHSTMT